MPGESFRFELRSVVESGPGSRRRVAGWLGGLGARRPLLVTDRGVRAAGASAAVEEALSQAGADVRIAGRIEDVPQDARTGAIEGIVAAYRAAGADAIVAVGGGSVIDAAKVARWALGRGVQVLDEALPGNRGERSPKAGALGLPLIALPTTAGTGAEVSPIAVVLNERLGIKVNLLSPYIAADVAILDAELTLGLPAEVTAYTGFDALTHAVEAVCSPRASGLSDAYALAALRTIARDLPRVVADGQDVAARGRMLVASLMAITAFGQALDAIPVHNLAHAIGGRFGLPHGLCNAVLLPALVAALPDFYRGRAGELLDALGAPVVDGPGGPDALAGHLRQLRQALGLPGDFGRHALPTMAPGELCALVAGDPSGVAYTLAAETVERVAQEVWGAG